MILERDGQREMFVAENVHPEPIRHYLLAPRTLRAVEWALKAGWRLAVVWHSHTVAGEGAERLSRADGHLSHQYPGTVQVLVHLPTPDGPAAVTAWAFKEAGWQKLRPDDAMG